MLRECGQAALSSKGKGSPCDTPEPEPPPTWFFCWLFWALSYGGELSVRLPFAE